MDFQLAGDVAAVGDDGVGGEVQLLRDFLVGEPLDHEHEDFLLAAAELFAVVRRAVCRGRLGGGVEAVEARLDLLRAVVDADDLIEKMYSTARETSMCME